MSLAIDFSAGTPMDEPGGYVLFDTDQRSRHDSRPRSSSLPGRTSASTSSPICSDPRQRPGGLHRGRGVLRARGRGRGGGRGPAGLVLRSARGVRERRRHDRRRCAIGDFNEPLDWVPDEGHGTVESFTDAPCIDAVPTEGVVPPGGSTDVEVTLGAADLPPGEYVGQLFSLGRAEATGVAHRPLADGRPAHRVGRSRRRDPRRTFLRTGQGCGDHRARHVAATRSSSRTWRTATACGP